MIFRNIFKKSKKREIVKMKDIIFAPRKEIIRLREKIWRLEISKKKINNFITANKKGLLVGGVFCFVLIFVAYSFLTTKAETSYFYPQTALGGWENSQNASGMPDIEEDENEEMFNINNSAVLKNSAGQIFLGDFQGDLPEKAILQKAFLKISLAIKKEPLPSPTSDIFNSEFPLVTPTPTSTPEISPSPEEEYLDDPTPTPKRDSIFMPELPVETPTPTPVLESTPELTPEIIITPSEIPILEITPTPELIPSPTPISESTPVSWWFKIFNFALAQELTPTPILILDPTPEPTSEISFSPEFIIIESSLPSETPIPEISLEPSFSSEISTPEPTNNEAEYPSPSPSSENEPEPTSLEIPILEATIELTPEPTPEPTPTPTPSAEDFLEIVYTFDGVNWNLLTKINRDNWQDLDFEIPDFQWDNLDSFQVSIQSLTTIDPIPEIYLDGITLEIEFEFEQITEENIPEFQEGVDDLQESPIQSLIIESPVSIIITTESTPTPKLKRKIDFNFQAKHSCQIEPFRIVLNEGDSIIAEILLKKSDIEKDYQLYIDNLPKGIEMFFVKNSDIVFLPGKNEEIVEVKIINSFESVNGSFNLLIVFEEMGIEKNSQTFCQFNLILK